ncbi:MAG: hypothetical protein ACLP6E_17505 [Acidimicrobiales bacterium]
MDLQTSPDPSHSPLAQAIRTTHADEPVDRLKVIAWRDPLIDHLGHDPRSTYAERFWLPVLGPTSLWLLRKVAGSLELRPEGMDLDLERTARQIGLGGHRGRHGPFRRAIGRLVTFELARFTDSGELEVRRFVPPLARRHLIRLDPCTQEQHREWLLGESRTDPAVTRLRWRARRLALGLVALGDDYATVELELVGWHLHPALASDAATWAWHQSGRREPETPSP